MIGKKAIAKTRTNETPGTANPFVNETGDVYVEEQGVLGMGIAGLRGDSFMISL